MAARKFFPIRSRAHLGLHFRTLKVLHYKIYPEINWRIACLKQIENQISKLMTGLKTRTDLRQMCAHMLLSVSGKESPDIVDMPFESYLGIMGKYSVVAVLLFMFILLIVVNRI